MANHGSEGERILQTKVGSKHIPRLKKLDKKNHWGTDKEAHKGGDFFKTETFD